MSFFETYLAAMQGLALGAAIIGTIAIPCILARWAWKAYERRSYDRYLAEMEARRKALPANVTVLYTTPSARVRVSK